MTTHSKRLWLFGLLSSLLLPMLIGCGGPSAVPISDRPPGKDISKEARADKRGDVRSPTN